MALADASAGRLNRGIAFSDDGGIAFVKHDVVGALTYAHDEGDATRASQAGVNHAAWRNTFTAAHACFPLLADGIAVGSYGVGVLLSHLKNDRASAFWCAPAFALDPSAANCVLEVGTDSVARLIATKAIRTGTRVVWSYPRKRMRAVATGDLFVAADGSGATQLFAGRNFVKNDDITVAPEAWFFDESSAYQSAWSAAVDALPSDDYYADVVAPNINQARLTLPTAPANFRERVAQAQGLRSTSDMRTLPCLPPPTSPPCAVVECVKRAVERFARSVDNPPADAKAAPWTPPPELAAACGLAAHASRAETIDSNALEKSTEDGQKKVIAMRPILCGEPVVIATENVPFRYRCIAGEHQALLLPRHGNALLLPYGTLYKLDGSIVNRDLMCMATAKGLQVVCTRPLGAAVSELGETYTWQALTWHEPRYVAYSCIAALDQLKPISDADTYQGALALVLGAYGATVADEKWHAFVKHTALSSAPYVPREGPYPPVKGFQVLDNGTLHDVWARRRAVCVYRRPLAYVAHDPVHGNGLYAMKPMLPFESLGPFEGHVFQNRELNKIMDPKSGSASAFQRLIEDYWIQATQTTQGQVAEYDIIPGWPSRTPFRVNDHMVLPFGKSSLNFPIGQINDALFESNKAYGEWQDIHQSGETKQKQARMEAKISEFLCGMKHFRVPNCMWCPMDHPQTGMVLKRKHGDYHGVFWRLGNNESPVCWSSGVRLRVENYEELREILNKQKFELGHFSGTTFKKGSPYDEAASKLSTFSDGMTHEVTWNVQMASSSGRAELGRSIQTTSQKVALPLVVALMKIAAHQELLCPYTVPIAHMLAMWANNEAAQFPQMDDVDGRFVKMLNNKLYDIPVTKNDVSQKLGLEKTYTTNTVDVHNSKLPDHQLYDPHLSSTGIAIQF